MFGFFSDTDFTDNADFHSKSEFPIAIETVSKNKCSVAKQHHSVRLSVFGSNEEQIAIAKNVSKAGGNFSTFTPRKIEL